MRIPRPTRRLWKPALAVVVLFAVVGWMVAWPAYQRYTTIEEIERVGGTVYRERTSPLWLRQFLATYRVVNVDLRDTRFTDSDLKHFRRLKRFEGLWLDNTHVTDKGLKHLCAFTNVKRLSLGHTQVTDDGLKYLDGLTPLELLWLNNTQVTDDGLKHLNNLTNLTHLYLHDTRVTDRGLHSLQKSLPNCIIYDRNGQQHFNIVSPRPLHIHDSR